MASNINRLLFEGYVRIKNPYDDGSNTDSESEEETGASNGYTAGVEGSTDSASSSGNKAPNNNGPPPNNNAPPINFETRKQERNAQINRKLKELEQKQTNRKLKKMYNNLHSARIQSVQQTRKAPQPRTSLLNRILSRKRGGRYRSKFTKKASRRRGKKM